MRRVRDLFVVLAAISWMVGRATNSTGKAAIVPITKLIRGLPIALEDFYDRDTRAGMAVIPATATTVITTATRNVHAAGKTIEPPWFASVNIP